MEKIEYYYIAYGSNLNIERMQHRCRGARVVGTGFLEDYALSFKGSNDYAYLTIERSKGSKVPFALWSIDKSDIKRLDYYEGYPDLYHKDILLVKAYVNNFGGYIKEIGHVYIMNEDQELAIPSKEYFNECLEGYYDFSFDPDILYEALDKSIKAQGDI